LTGFRVPETAQLGSRFHITAAQGHRVVGVYVNPLKIEQLEAGKSPVVEPGISLNADRQQKFRGLQGLTQFYAILTCYRSLLCLCECMEGITISIDEDDL
jgi:UDP-glucose 6-dehydrogenase